MPIFARKNKLAEHKYMKNLLTTTILALASVMSFASCGGTQKKESMQQSTDNRERVLVAFFSHTGENYGVGNITKGNTHIIAEMIATETGGDLFEIVPEKAYPDKYEPCTDVAKQEKEAGARPAITTDKDIADYDVVYIGYPIWWGDAPMPVYTWIEKHDWTGKTVIPFCTHEGSGLGDSGTLIGNACKGATLGNGFELTGTTAQKQQDEALKAVKEWLDK